MPLIQLSKLLAALAAIALANLVFFMCFAIAVFGFFDFFYAGIGLLNLLVCGLILRTVFLRRSYHLWTGLEFIFYGLLAVSARFVITDIALIASGALILAGLLALTGTLLGERSRPLNRP